MFLWERRSQPFASGRRAQPTFLHGGSSDCPGGTGGSLCQRVQLCGSWANFGARSAPIWALCLSFSRVRFAKNVFLSNKTFSFVQISEDPIHTGMEEDPEPRLLGPFPQAVSVIGKPLSSIRWLRRSSHTGIQ